MSIMKKARQIGRERNKVQTTVFKLEEYVIDQDPRKSKMVGYDMFNKDQNGNPKKVEVYHFHKDNKTNSINDFANRSAMMHTRPGGLIRLSQYKVRPDGAYVTSHMQRIAEEDGPKIAANQSKFDIHYMKGWAKVYPFKNKDNRNELLIQKSNNGNSLRHKANIMVIPEDAKPVAMHFGSDTFDSELKTVLEKAINNAPKGTRPMIVVREKNYLGAKEIVIPNFKRDADQNLTPLTKEEMINAAMETKELSGTYLPTHEAMKGAGETGELEFVPGFNIQAIGLKWDGRSMKKNPQTGEDEPAYIDKSKIEEWIQETAQYHALPKGEDDAKPRYVMDKGAPQYTASVLSYRVRQVADGEFASADLDTLGRDLGAKIRTSPNAGLDVKPNPHQPKEQPAASQATQTAPAQPVTEPAPAAATAAQPAPAQPAPAQVVEEEDMEELDDFGLSDFTEEDFGDSLDELEEQMSHQQL